MLSVVLVNWNGWADTLACIQTLLNSQVVSFRIVVVDNMSTNESFEIFERWASLDVDLIPTPIGIGAFATGGARMPRNVHFLKYLENERRFIDMKSGTEISELPRREIYFVESGKNGGFGFACNVGMRLADELGTDGYWLLNNDSVVPPQSLSRMSNAVTTKKNSAFGSIVRYYDNPELIQSYGGGKLSRLTGKNFMLFHEVPDGELDYLYGASVGFSSQVRDKVGDFDENIFMYYEEIDFCIRLTAVGCNMQVVDADVFHRHGGSQGGASITAWRHVFVNKWYVLKKHYGLGIWCVFFLMSLIIRCINPFSEIKAATGARLALNELFSKKVSS